MIRVQLSDLAGLAYCRRGTRDFYRQHGLDYMELLTEGTPIEKLESIDDEMVRMAVAAAKQREGMSNE
jgi:hypothetical protein